MVASLSVGWHIDHDRAGEVDLSPPARRIVRLIGYGQCPKITPRTFDAICELLEHDVLMHGTYAEQCDRLRHLGEMVAATNCATPDVPADVPV